MRSDVKKSDLENLLIVNGETYENIGKIYGVSDNTIRKWCKQFNIELPNRKNKERPCCLHCGKKLKRQQQKFCNNTCQGNFEYEEYIQKWKKGLVDGNRGKYRDMLSNHVRRYIFQKYDNKCVKCGWNEINPITNKVPLQIDHKDGNYLNSVEENLEPLCPNCHSLTPTYGSLNTGNGRKYRWKLK
jgi:transposase